jgi:hypothetical protein
VILINERLISFAGKSLTLSNNSVVEFGQWIEYVGKTDEVKCQTSGFIL